MMKVKIFDFEHEKDLEDSINDFLSENHNIKDIKYSISSSISGEEQIYCYSALILYNDLHHV
ncbi:MAG: sporulation protein Cse60 [Bacilli bacterium]|nr:sporulation protein Cse60 [Bacilli bacterium]